MKTNRPLPGTVSTGSQFLIYLILFHKFTHEVWQRVLERFGLNSGIFGSNDWLGSHRTASDRLQEMWLADLFRLENEVVNRLTQNQSFGVFSAGISLDLEGSYQSQIGFGGWLTTIIPTLLGLSGESARFAIYLVPAAVSAGIVTVITKALELNFSIRRWMVFAFLLTQPWLIAFGTWPLVFGLRLLPILFLFRALARGQHDVWSICLAPALLMIPGFASGYEFATVIVGMGLAAVAYFAVQRQWSFWTTLRMMIQTVVSFVLGLGLTLLLHLVQLRLRHGSFARGLEILEYQLSKRSGVGENSVTDPLLLESADAPLRLVMDWYLAVPVILSPARVPILGELTVGMLLVACAMLTGLLIRRGLADTKSRQSAALGIATIVSTLGPLSWIFLFRPWVYIHTHWAGVIWAFPTIPLATLFLVSTFRYQPEHHVASRETASITMVAVTFVGIAASYFVALVMS